MTREELAAFTAFCEVHTLAAFSIWARRFPDEVRAQLEHDGWLERDFWNDLQLSRQGCELQARLRKAHN